MNKINKIEDIYDLTKKISCEDTFKKKFYVQLESDKIFLYFKTKDGFVLSDFFYAISICRKGNIYILYLTDQRTKKNIDEKESNNYEDIIKYINDFKNKIYCW